VGPFHHGLAHHSFVDGEGYIHIWRVAMNVLNKQLQSAKKHGASA